MNKKKIIILGIAVLTIALISGISFALWQITLKQESTNVITTGCFKIELEEENPISLENAFPITDEEGSKLVPYTFTITNTCESYASYQINLEILNSTTLENFDYLKIMFEDNIDVLSKKENVSKTLENAITSKKLEKGYLDMNESKTYHLRLWMSEDTPNDASFMNQVFQSKVTVIATYLNEFDHENPIAVLNATKENGKVTMDASSSTDSTSIKNYYYSLDGENWITSKNSTYEFHENREIEYGIGTNAITSLYNSTIHKVYVKVEDEYGNMSEMVSTVFLDELEYDETTDNNLRYIGASPNNYVSFNNELWRVIGVMNNIEDGTGKKESRIKLIRNESIGSYSWDSSSSDINSGYGINEWSQADAMKLLNPGYESETGGSLYWKRLSGLCYNDQINLTTACDFTNSGLLNESQDYIKMASWNLGNNGEEYESLTAQKIYYLERNYNLGKICEGGVYCTDTVLRTYKWNGFIGLMNPSDYVFSTMGDELTNRKDCLNTSSWSWNSEDKTACKNNNWMYLSNQEQWAMIPHNNPTYANTAYFISNDGNAWSYYGLSCIPKELRPVVYLKPEINIISGQGSQSDPFVLSL